MGIGPLDWIVVAAHIKVIVVSVGVQPAVRGKSVALEMAVLRNTVSEAGIVGCAAVQKIPQANQMCRERIIKIV